METTAGSDWLACVDNPKAITSLYEQAPGLNVVVLHRVSLNEHGWACNFTVAIPVLPVTRPRRWSDGVNTVQIEFGIAELLSFRVPQMERWPVLRTVQLVFAQRAEEVLVEATGQLLRVELIARRLHICGITALKTERLWDGTDTRA